MTAPTYWLCNTDETEVEGKDAYEKMIQQSCIAAWGNCNGQGAEKTLNKPNDGDTVFLYCACQGIVASGQATEEPAFKSHSIFGKDTPRAFKRPIANMKRLTPSLSVSEIEEKTGYTLPYRHTVCRLFNPKAIKFIGDYAETGISLNGAAVKMLVKVQNTGAGVGDYKKNRRVEKAAIRYVSKMEDGRSRRASVDGGVICWEANGTAPWRVGNLPHAQMQLHATSTKAHIFERFRRISRRCARARFRTFEWPFSASSTNCRGFVEDVRAHYGRRTGASGAFSGDSKGAGDTVFPIEGTDRLETCPTGTQAGWKT